MVVDVLARIRGGKARSDESAYADDYAFASRLKALADRFGVAFVVVHHSRKAKADDFVEGLSGTNGLAGAADTIRPHATSASRTPTSAPTASSGRAWTHGSRAT